MIATIWAISLPFNVVDTPAGFVAPRFQRPSFPLFDPDREVLTAWGALPGEKRETACTSTVDEDGKIVVAQYNVKATGHVAKFSATCRYSRELKKAGGRAARSSYHPDAGFHDTVAAFRGLLPR